MYRLKRFGALALNFLKNRQKRRVRLKSTLFLQPLGILILAFLSILLLFQLAMRYFINEHVDEAIQYQYDVLDARYVGKELTELPDETIFSPIYVIVNENHETVYLSASQDDLTSSVVSDEVVAYFYEHDDDWEFFDQEEQEEAEIEESDRGSSPVLISLEDSRYAVKIREYEGELKDYFVRQSQDKDQTYYVLIFVNTTPLDQFSRLIQLILWSLMAVIGCVAVGLIYLTSQKVDRDFARLKAFIYHVGKREKKASLDSLAFVEFQEVKQSVEEMDHLIAANERSQKLFFQNASHELRTPLMSIQGYAEAIQEEVVDNPRHAAGIIQAESQKMKELVDEILQLSRMEDVSHPLRLEEIDLQELLYDVSWRLKGQADKKGIALVHNLTLENPILDLDEALMEKAFANILSNAIRYAKEAIHIETIQKEEQVYITISNDGPKIADKDLPHIFERFYKGADGHVGIGLAMTKDLIERMGGKIHVETNDEETAFILTFYRN
ncbi:sensor histidine kinase [Streptococcus cameli]